MSPDGPGDGPGSWVSVAEAARRLGVTPRAVRLRIERRIIRWRPVGNQGKEVWLGPGDVPETSDGESSGVPPAEALLRELAEVRERVGRLAGELAEARASRERETAALREALEESRGRARAAETMLAEALRPWWARLFRSPGTPGDVS